MVKVTFKQGFFAILASVALCLAAHGYAKTSPKPRMNIVVVSGDGYAFSLAVPQGWVADDKSGKAQGMAALFCPASLGLSGPVIAYVSVASKGTPGNESLEKVLVYDTQRYKAERHVQKVQNAGPIVTKGKLHKAVLKYFAKDADGRYEAVAYLDSKRTVNILVLSTKDRATFRKYLELFKSFVASYVDISEIKK